MTFARFVDVITRLGVAYAKDSFYVCASIPINAAAVDIVVRVDKC